MLLPVSYHKAQLEYFGWDGEVFRKNKKGGWRSKLNDGRWQDQRPRLKH